jgi:hypothetical protein
MFSGGESYEQHLWAARSRSLQPGNYSTWAVLRTKGLRRVLKATLEPAQEECWTGRWLDVHARVSSAGSRTKDDGLR